MFYFEFYGKEKELYKEKWRTVKKIKSVKKNFIIKKPATYKSFSSMYKYSIG